MATSSCFRQGRPSQLEVEINIFSANLKPLDSKGRVYFSGRLLRAYAVTWVSTNSDEISETSIDRSGDTNPTWNKMFVIPLKVSSVDQSTLHIKISDDGKQDTAGVDEIIGSVSLPLCEVGIGKEPQVKKMEVINRSGYPQGKLKFRVMVRYHQGAEDYPYHDDPPRPSYGVQIPPKQPPPPPPLPTFKDYYPYHDDPPRPSYGVQIPPKQPPPPPPLPTFKDYYPPSAPPYEDYLQFGNTSPTTRYPYSPPPPHSPPNPAIGYPQYPHSCSGRCPHCQLHQLPYWQQGNVIGTMFAVGVGIGVLLGVVLGMNPEMLERVLGFTVFVLTVFFGFLLMSCCTCEEY